LVPATRATPGAAQVIRGGGSGLVARPVFKTAMESPSVALVGSIPTRSRHLVAALPAVLLLLLVRAPRVLAQDTTAVRSDTAAAPADTTHPAPPPAADTGRTTVPESLGVLRVRPSAALWRSLLVPGWGQAKLGRNLTAGFFIAAEALTVGMTLKANSELGYLRRTGADSASIDAKSRKREDWIVFTVVNHLLSGLEAYVAANLSDFPGELKLRRAPSGVEAQVSVPVRFP
jgi:hypothetical protein